MKIMLKQNYTQHRVQSLKTLPPLSLIHYSEYWGITGPGATVYQGTGLTPRRLMLAGGRADGGNADLVRRWVEADLGFINYTQVPPTDYLIII